MKIISLWSGPRNVSTALMYSFAQLNDVTVIDEPLYAHYLSKTDVTHPGDQEVLETMEHDGTKVLRTIIEQEENKPILFLKNMAHHWIELDDRWLHKFENVFLIRNPEEMLPSLIHQLPHPTLRDTALKTQVDLFEKLTSNGHSPMIVDSKNLLLNPKEILSNLCSHLDISYSPSMLTWPKGARKEDGIWAKYWYHNVHKSEGFSPYSVKNEPFPSSLRPLLEECRPYYNYLYERSIKAN